MHTYLISSTCSHETFTSTADSWSHHVTTAPYHQKLHTAPGQWTSHTDWSLLPLPHFHFSRRILNLQVHVEAIIWLRAAGHLVTWMTEHAGGGRASCPVIPNTQVLMTIYRMCQQSLWLSQPRLSHRGRLYGSMSQKALHASDVSFLIIQEVFVIQKSCDIPPLWIQL